MKRTILAASAVALALAFITPGAQAQSAPADGWRPPGEMPQMPQATSLQGDWLPAVASWFAGSDRMTGVAPDKLRPLGEGKTGEGRAQYVRFRSGPMQVVAWSDRNGDGRADLIEYFRSGSVVLQVIDPDYDGRANVLRLHDAQGKFLREDRL